MRKLYHLQFVIALPIAGWHHGAMSKKYHLQRPDLALAVASALETCRDVKDHQRLLAMRMAASGQFTASQIAEQIGISRRQLINRARMLKDGGVDGLLRRAHGGGAPPSVRGEVLEQLEAGLKQGRWKRAREIQSWLADRHKVELGLSGVYYWLGKLGGVLRCRARSTRERTRPRPGSSSGRSATGWGA